MTWTWLVWPGLDRVSAVMWYISPPCLHAHAEGVQLAVEVLGGFRQNQAGIQTRVPDTAEAQWNLLDQVMDWVAFHEHRLVRIEVDALLRDGQDTKAGASQPRDGHQVMGPHSVTYRERNDEGGWLMLRIKYKYALQLYTQCAIEYKPWHYICWWYNWPFNKPRQPLLLLLHLSSFWSQHGVHIVTKFTPWRNTV